MATAPIPTPLDVDRYVQLESMVSLMSNTGLGELMPAVDLNEIDFTSRHNAYSYRNLFEAIIPPGEEDTPRTTALFARGCLLTARMLRSLTPELLEAEAAQQEALAAGHLHRVARSQWGI